MNVLILTPDAVGSTLLQRLITIYMQFHQYDRPVINLHELTNGLAKYYNDFLQQDVVGKLSHTWGYHQSLKEIVDMLKSVDHYKTSRLAQYHIRARQDPIEDQISFYQYLNENFYIISCRRHNVFEHALSRCLTKITKKLNVYTSDEKLKTFFDIYKHGVQIDPHSLIQTLDAYRDYLKWCQDYFEIASYFLYEEHLPRIESYILNLPIFNHDFRLTWNDKFGMDFNTWNRYRYVSSNLGALCLEKPQAFAGLSYQGGKSVTYQKDLAALPNIGHSLTDHAVTTVDFRELLPADQQDFLHKHEASYNKTCEILDHMIGNGIMISQPPVKKQTLAEKKHIILNYDHLLEVYNRWIQDNPGVGAPIDNKVLDSFADKEQRMWQNLEDQERAPIQLPGIR
jgi:hypothetical protein